MPQLRKEDAASLVYGVDDWLPSYELSLRVQPRRVWIPSQQEENSNGAASLRYGASLWTGRRWHSTALYSDGSGEEEVQVVSLMVPPGL